MPESEGAPGLDFSDVRRLEEIDDPGPGSAERLLARIELEGPIDAEDRRRRRGYHWLGWMTAGAAWIAVFGTDDLRWSGLGVLAAGPLVLWMGWRWRRSLDQRRSELALTLEASADDADERRRSLHGRADRT